MRRRLFVLAACFGLLASVATVQTALDDKFFDSNGVKIRYVDVGQGEPVVVLIHGFSSSIEGNWGAPGVIAALEHDFRVVALDCRGHGKSDKPHDASAYGYEMVEDVARLMDHISIRRAHIVGYSMGGAITGKFIVAHPDRVITAVFGGSSPRLGWTVQNERDSEELATSLEQGHGMRPLILRLLPPGEPKPADDVIDRQSQASVGRNDPLALAAAQRGGKQQVVTLGEVRALKMPLLAVIGSADPIKVGVDAFKKLRPDLNVVVIDGATHSGARGAPARPEFRTAVHDFIAAHKVTPTM
ncbi:MAG: alpha/beta hydrolase [Acidobacteria bacterium]|nr:alpha/beta hydrolase [Acidobacteriota bacterium]